MSAVSYKELLTNMLIVFINKRIQESKDIADKVEALEDERKKKFHSKVVNYVISKAKGLAELQGTQYLGVEDSTVVDWINSFFDEFEENMKEPEKPKPTKATTTSSSNPLAKDISYDIEEGFFGIEIKFDKKTILSKEEFIKKMKEQYKDKKYELVWETDKVTVKFIKEKEKAKPKEVVKEVEEETEVEIEEDGPGVEVEEAEDEDEQEEAEDEDEQEEEIEEEDGLF